MGLLSEEEKHEIMERRGFKSDKTGQKHRESNLVIHHIDRNTKNNKPENLRVLSTPTALKVSGLWLSVVSLVSIIPLALLIRLLSKKEIAAISLALSGKSSPQVLRCIAHLVPPLLCLLVTIINIR